MKKLSIVLPAYGVQGYLRECLDSILGQSFTDFEVIAVDDCSPDRSGEILDEYARRDPRVDVLHLEQKVGLGEDRNIGLERATGEYVWFVDSDDWLGDGALQAINDRLQETKPDVLIFDYARAYWWGKTERNVLQHLFRDPPPPDVFTLRERPSAMHFMMTAWNKAIRRQFLVDLGLRFGRGYYEDVPVTYPILMAAERISLLDRLCYYYRQRRGGAITKTTSDKHLDAFGQYEKIFAFMDRQGAAVEEFRSTMFARMMWHYVIILGRGDRVSRAARLEFFRRMSEHYRTYEPRGGLKLGRLDTVKYRLIKKGAYRTFTIFKVANQLRLWLRDRKKSLRRTYRRYVGAAWRRVLRVYYRVQLRLPMDEQLAVYAAYWFRGYACNPAAIYEKARELAPSVRGVWVVRAGETAAMPAGVDYVRADTPTYYRTMARAKYLINNVNYPDDIVKRKGSVHVMTHHGTPLKTMGLDLQRYPVGANRMNFKALLMRSDRWDFSISSNRLSTEAWERCYPCDYQALESGYPRNDRLVTATGEDVARARSGLGVAPGRTAVLYTPTFRDYQKGFEPPLDLAALSRALGPEYVLLVRAHYYYTQDERLQDLQRSGHLIDVSTHPSIEDLFLASDVLLTDYSSVMFDYAVLDRPIVIYAHDWDTYRRTRGVYFDLMAEPPGVVATTMHGLVDAFRSGAAWGEQAAAHRAEFRRCFCQLDDGHASERVVRRVFLGEDVAFPQRSAGELDMPVRTERSEVRADEEMVVSAAAEGDDETPSAAERA
ncbi:MAG: bifunctional glycosyltransferase/CDP-glycerol:glycerophosphate glycerophosphotransferase [Streptomycetales bacterium]